MKKHFVKLVVVVIILAIIGGTVNFDSVRPVEADFIADSSPLINPDLLMSIPVGTGDAAMRAPVSCPPVGAVHSAEVDSILWDSFCMGTTLVLIWKVTVAYTMTGYPPYSTCTRYNIDYFDNNGGCS